MRKAILIFSLLMFAGIVFAPTVGLRTGNGDLGTIPRGETVESAFYVNVQGATQPVAVNPSCDDYLTSRIFDEKKFSEIEKDEYSQQEICDWVEFEKDQVIINPSTTKEFDTGNGKVVADGRVRFELRVPNDPEEAEPGYHAFMVNPHPSKASGAGGGVVSNWMIAQTGFFFEVPGNAERELSLEDVRAVRTGENRVQIITSIRNTGTVTTTLKHGQAAIVDSQNRKLDNFSLNPTKIAPGETEVFDSTWGGNIEGGEYGVEGTADYITGKAYLSGDFTITDVIKERVEIRNDNNDGSGGDDSNESGSPIWLVVMFLVLLGVVLYSFDFDPFWIVVILGITGFMAMIMLTGLPILLIPVVLILSIIIYLLK